MTKEELEQWVDDLQSGMYINCVYCGHRYGPNSVGKTTMRKALGKHISKCPKHPLSAAKAEITVLKESVESWKREYRLINAAQIAAEERVKELEATFDLIHAADQRAIKLWQEAHPGKGNMWPDQAKMVVWLMERVAQLESTPDFARGFNAGRDSTLRRNPSGCCCKFTDEKEGEDIISMCAAHKEYFSKLEAENKRLNEALQKIHDLCVSDSRWWNDESHAPDHHRPITRILQKFNKIAREALMEAKDV